MTGETRPVLSVVSPAYNESENLPELHGRLKKVLDAVGLDWEWIVVDDHSSDETFEVLRRIAAADPRVRGVRLARNSGSHAALLCGLHSARGDCAVVLAADLQDPPEVVESLLLEWRAGFRVVWAVRRARQGERASTRGLARLYYWLMRRLAGLREMPPMGADFALLDRRVVDALRQFPESNASLFALITWMGFRQSSVEYVKQARAHGRSGWSLAKKVKLAIDSAASFTYLPIRLMSAAGFLVALFGFAYAAFVVHNAVTGRPAEGWSSLIIVVLLLGGMQMMMMGVLGEYLWRALDEARRRPRYIIEETTGGRAGDGPMQSPP